jgi:prophage regulatory protein
MKDWPSPGRLQSPHHIQIELNQPPRWAAPVIGPARRGGICIGAKTMNTNPTTTTAAKPARKPRSQRIAPAAQLPRYVSIRAVAEATGLSRRHLYTMMENNQIPKPVRLSEQRVAFRERDILEWLSSRPEVTYSVRFDR